ncbi:MAG: hypothetical protein JWQ87_2257 [Candidatus Sulfotelmatobacter sp.]|nr:hypothetical protein [Candidatus Sulfotelmatobacter sp.]
MEFIFGCALLGLAFVFFASLASGIFLDMKKRREEKELDISQWKR